MPAPIIRRKILGEIKSVVPGETITLVLRVKVPSLHPIELIIGSREARASPKTLGKRGSPSMRIQNLKAGNCIQASCWRPV